MSKPNDEQVGGDHYKKFGDLQHWDIVHYFNLDYFQAQILRYVMRWKDKDGLQDLHKAEHYIKKYISLNAPVQEPIPRHMTVEENMLGGVSKKVHWDHYSSPHFCLEGVQGNRAEYTCRKCNHTFWVNGGEKPECEHNCLMRDSGFPTGRYTGQD